MFQPYILIVTHKVIGENRGERGAQGFTIPLIVERNLEQEVIFFGSKLKKPF